MKVTAVIEKGSDGFYSVYVTDDLPGFGLNGAGASVEEAKKEMLAAYDEIKEIMVEEGKTVPDLEFEYQYDLKSFFDYFDWINVTKLAKKLKINRSLLSRYKHGDAFASEKQLSKIQRGLQELGGELLAVNF